MSRIPLCRALHTLGSRRPIILQARSNLARLLDQVISDREIVVIHRRSGEDVALFHPEFREDLRYWVETKRKTTTLRIFSLIEAIRRDPYT